MAIETAEDLAAMFSLEDFGEAMVAHMANTSVPFHGIATTGHVSESPGTTADVSMMVPRIIARRASVANLAQTDEIEMADGRRVIVNDIHYKGELAIIHYHEHW